LFMKPLSDQREFFQDRPISDTDLSIGLKQVVEG
jgi:hypothetical protein